MRNRSRSRLLHHLCGRVFRLNLDILLHHDGIVGQIDRRFIAGYVYGMVHVAPALER